MTLQASSSERRIWTVYCEGFHDRDFLAGLFEDVLRFDARRGEPGVPRGLFAFRHSDAEIWLQSCGSKSKVIPAFDSALREAYARRPAGLVMCLDERDDDEVSTSSQALQSARDRIGVMVAGALMTERTMAGGGFEQSAGLLRLGDGFEVRLASITWCCVDPEGEHLPRRQNLERLITAACCEAYPDRGPTVRAWLDSRPAPPNDAPSRDKAFSWSHMAGWYPSPGGSDFFRAVWRDPRTRAALCRRLSTTGIDSLVTGLGITPPWAVAAPDSPTPNDEPSAR